MENFRLINKLVIERFNQAIQFEKQGLYEKALLEYVSIITENVQFREAYVNLGSLFYRMNYFHEALQCYEKAILLGRDYVTYFNIGSIHYKLNQYKKSVINLEKSCTLNPSFDLPLLVIGLCYSRLNNIQAAEFNFRTVLNKWPDNRIALTALSIILYNQDNYEQSLLFINKLLVLDGSNSKFRDIKFNILYKTGNLSESAQEIQTLRKISDGYKYYDEYIASISNDLLTDRFGTLDEKISFLNEISQPNSSKLISLSLCHLFKGEADMAI